ncbi:hypothetical protein ADK41_37360 [Streptomyces caelestis]|uniref:Uncharacterized protein n=1 Tax=Streptomyces caelestis TaxID=36816 RepID=A0A0M8QCV5_9ACTN|nr:MULTISPECIES: hypothetical protein [Streptomyces]KOT26888.1 hypothetical protein ADK41_37360 [Streptomyces caelestis]
MTGCDLHNEGVLSPEEPLKAHALFQMITRPNRTRVSPTGFVKTSGAVVDYTDLTEEVQRAVVAPATSKGAGKGGGFVNDVTEPVAESRTTLARIENPSRTRTVWTWLHSSPWTAFIDEFKQRRRSRCLVRLSA